MLRRLDELRRLGDDLETKQALTVAEHDERLARADRQREHVGSAAFDRSSELVRRSNAGGERT